MRTPRLLSGGIVLLIILGACATVSDSRPRSATQESPAPDSATGEELARSLGLERHSAPPAGCGYYVEVEGGGYCLDALEGTSFDKWEVSQRLQGRIPSALDEEIFRLELQINELAGTVNPDDPQLQALMRRLDELLQQPNQSDG